MPAFKSDEKRKVYDSYEAGQTFRKDEKFYAGK